MAINWIWVLFASIAVLGSVFYNVAVKVAGAHANPFIFTVIITLVAFVGHLLCLAFYKYYMNEAVAFQLDKIGLWMALIAGAGIVMIDLSFFFAVKQGGLMASTGFWVIGSLVLTTLASYFIFQEGVTLTKMAGIVLGAVSLYLLTKA